MPDPFAWCAGELARLEHEGLRRRPVTVSSRPGPEVTIGGRQVIQLCSNDYLGLAGDPRVRRAAAEAAHRWGAGTGASRLVSGTTDLHRSLEVTLARLKGCEDAVVFSSGYLANVGTIAAMVGPQDAVFSDELNHASIIDGCRLSGAHVVVYRHSDVDELDRGLGAADVRRKLVVTDTVFSMQGDLAPVPDIARVCDRHGAMLMVDDAHATGLLEGAGSGARGGPTPPDKGKAIVMSTLSKALGSSGGFVAGSRDLVEWLRNRARTYVFDTAPAPASVGAALEALRIIDAEPQRGQRVVAAAAGLAEALRDLGYDVAPPAAAIVPVLVGEDGEAMALSARLLEHGVFVPAIRPPSVPAGTARLRVTVTAAHTEEHLAAAVEAFAAVRPGDRRSRTSPRRRPRETGIDPRIVAAGGVFVTGTGTGVGKTVVAAALARTLQRAGLGVAAMKPAQTGTAGGADDLAFIRLAGGVPAARLAAPYALQRPLAPAVAARLEGATLEAGPILEAFRQLRSQADVAVVEGAGGLLVPFNDAMDMADLAVALHLPVVVVALPGLGTLNHIALTLEAARSRGLAVAGVVLSGFPADPGVAEATNPAEIGDLAGVVPHLPGLDVDRTLVPPAFEPATWLAPGLGGTFDREAFLGTLSLTGERV